MRPAALLALAALTILADYVDPPTTNPERPTFAHHCKGGGVWCPPKVEQPAPVPLTTLRRWEVVPCDQDNCGKGTQ